MQVCIRKSEKIFNRD